MTKSEIKIKGTLLEVGKVDSNGNVYTKESLKKIEKQMKEKGHKVSYSHGKLILIKTLKENTIDRIT